MNGDAKVYIFENSYHLTNYYTKLWTQIAVDAICDRGRFVTALSGGRTPVEFFSKLSSVDVFDLWRNTFLFQADEHFVGLNERDNNMKMIRDNLLDYINIPKKNVFPIYTDVDNAMSAARQYQSVLEDFFGGDMPVFDLVNLGIGADGHTASLFSDSLALTESVQWVVPVSSAEIPNGRITLTCPVLNQARHVVFHVQGKNKALAVKEILQKNEKFPATYVSPESGSLTFLLDKDAASELVYGDDYTNVDEGIMVKI